jgi:serine phosphatase RsbU (regulator of sigma subunit)
MQNGFRSTPEGGPVLEDPHRSIGRLLSAFQTAEPDAIVSCLMTATEPLAATDLVFYLIDYEHASLMPHPDVLPHGERPEVAKVDGSMAGRAFQTGTVLTARRGDAWQVWVPVQERANMLGVLAMRMPEFNQQIEDFCVELGYAAAYLLMASAHYTDLPHRLRRREDMDLAAEMQWSLLPPLSYAGAGVSLAGLLEPAYEVGGDCFDYAVNDRILDLAIFDAMGHGLTSAVLASLLVGAYRHRRRGSGDLADIAREVDAAARTFPGPTTFATTLLARLQIATGQLSWLTCGHPQPIIVRRGATLPAATISPGVPAGLGALGSVVGTRIEVALEPEDGVLFYTDGVTEARDPAGEYFGEERLRDLLGREHLAGGPPQEIVRRLVRSALDHSQVRLGDDATLLYLQWDPPIS